ncbi:uncharacterized protein LOC144099057 isoform X5 [Amblyomma americanum]
MPDELSVKLCKLVQQHPEVYDILNDNYHNEEAKNNAWEAIAQELGVPKSKCVIKWKSLKHQFIKAKKEQNTEWDMWPWLQFCDDAAAVKGGSRKRKRESTAMPVQMVVPADDSATEPRALSRSPLKGEAKEATAKAPRAARAWVATTQQQSFLSQIPLENWRFPRSPSFGATVATTQSPQESFLSQIPLEHWRTKASPSVPQSSNKLPEPAAQPAATSRPPTLKRTARMSTCGASYLSSTGPTVAKPQQTLPSALRASSNSKESPKKNVTSSPAPSWQQAMAGKTPPRGRRSTARTPRAETVSEEQVDNLEVGPQPQQASKESSKKGLPASLPPSKQQDMASRTPRGRRSTMRPVVAPEVIPEDEQPGSSSAEDEQPKRASKESPKKDAAASPQPRSRRLQATASKTPRGRRSTASKESPKKDVAASPQPRGRRSTARPVIAAEVIPEDEQAGSSSAKDQQHERASKESPKKDVAASPQPRSRRQEATASKTPRGRRSTASKESPKKDAAASPQPRSRRQQDTASKTPRGRRSTARPVIAAEVIPEDEQAGSSSAKDQQHERASKESPKKDVAASPQPRSRRLQATASKTPRGRRSTARPVIAVEVIPEDEQAGSSSAKDQQPKRASKESPKKDAAASPQPRSRRLQATASKTPRGRRSTARPVLAEVAEEEQQAGSSKDEEPRTKRASSRIAGNGVGADNQADALRDMAFSTVLDRKFFKLLQKFATLRPEVVSAKKADILKMLGEAAEG